MGSEDEYQRSLDLWYRRRQASAARSDEGELLDAHLQPHWDRYLPPAPDGWTQEVVFDLTEAEAEYLTHRISLTADTSLLFRLLDRGAWLTVETRFPWELGIEAELPQGLARQLTDAQNFSEAMHGASFLYNLMLAEEAPGHRYIDRYRELLDGWWVTVQSRSSELHGWDRAGFWQTVRDAGGRVTAPTHGFVETWLTLLLRARGIGDLADSAAARSLIIHRELQLKRARVRIGNPRALEYWRGSSGAAQLDYRWNRPVRTIINDILQAQMAETSLA